jgi:tocopherol O-methyltransferase
MSTVILEEQIIRYYDDYHREFQLATQAHSPLSLHYGYWNKQTSGQKEALINLDRKVAKVARIRQQDLILDAGCGFGGSAFFLANKYQCRVEGITLSEKEVHFARARAAEYQLNDHVHFSVGNFTSTNFPDETFDVVWAIESVCHAPEKLTFLTEAYRILKPKGRLVVADYFGNRRLCGTKNDWLQKWAACVAIPGFEYFPDFIDKITKAGFSRIASTNVTGNIAPFARNLWIQRLPGYFKQSVLDLLDPRRSGIPSKEKAAFYQFKALKEQLWNYHLIWARKSK